MNYQEPKRDSLWTPTFIALMGINFGAALAFYLTMVIMTEFSMDTYAVDYGTAAWAVTVFVLASLLTRLFLGGKIDEWGPKFVLTLGLVLSLIANAAYIAPMPFWLLMVMRIVQGIGFAFASGSAAAAAAMVLAPSRKAEGIGYFSMTQALATGIGPFLAVFLRGLTGGYLALFICTTIVSALSLCIVPVLKVARSSKEQGTPCNSAVERPKGINRFLHTSVLLLSPSLFLVYIGYSGVVSFVVPFAGETGLSDAVSFYFVLYALAILISRPPIGRRVDKSGERPIIYWAFAAVVIGLIALAFSTNAFLLLFSSVFLGFGIGAVQSILQAVVARDTAPAELGRANSTFFMSMDLGAGVGPIVIGGLIPSVGFFGCYIALAIAALLACVLYILLGRKMK